MRAREEARGRRRLCMLLCHSCYIYGKSHHMEGRETSHKWGRWFTGEVDHSASTKY